MDRPIVYPGAVPLETDILSTNRNTLAALAFLAQATLGTGPAVDGLACTPGTGLTVSVGTGSIYQLAALDATAYSSLASNSTQVVKQGINLAATVLATPAPGTVGQSINYLVEAQFQEVDNTPVVLPFYNSANPAIAFNGPGGGGGTSNTVRADVCALQVKAGTAATTGTQTTPAADGGWTPLYVVTVANGASSISSGNIVVSSLAPFVPNKLGQLDVVKTIGASQAVGAAHAGLNFQASAALTLTVAAAGTLPNGYTFSAVGKGGIVTLAPTGTDSIGGGAAGASFTLGLGASAMFVRDDSGTGWTVLFYSNPFASVDRYVGATPVSASPPGYYLADTSAGSFTLTLIAAPVKGDGYTFTDAAATWGANPLTIARNGQTIMGLAQDLICNVANQRFTLWFNGTTWRLL